MGKSRDIRFINRVFTPDEQKQLLDSTNPDTMLWALWTAKETAYKIASKSHAAVFSVPRAYKVNFEADLAELDENSAVSGVVETSCGPIQMKVFQTCDFVHCIGTTGTFKAIDSIIWGVQRINTSMNESFFVRKAARKSLSLYLNHNPDEIEIRRLRGPYGLEPPIVYVKDRRAMIDISLSHEGRFVAYAFTADFSF